MMVAGVTATASSAAPVTPWECSTTNSFACTEFAGYSAANTGYTWLEQWYGATWGVAPDGHNCTRYVAYRMAQAGIPQPTTNFGDAQFWDTEVKAEYGSAVSVQQTPVVGSIAQWESGHVAWVDDVTYANGIWTAYTSEDNFNTNVTARDVIVQGDSDRPSNFIVFLKEFGVVEAPSIGGSGVVDSLLTPFLGGWTPAATSVTYGWYRDGSVLVSSAATYTPGQADIGHDIVLKITGNRDGYFSKTQSSPPLRITASTFSFSGAPAALSGTAKVEYSLSASSGLQTGGVTTTITWLRNGVARQYGGSTLALNSADIGTSISVRYEFTKTGYQTVTSTSPAVGVAGYSAYSFSGAPAALSGTAKVEYTLSASSGLTTAGVTSSVTWLRNGAVRQNGGSTLALTAADIGTSITVRYAYDKLGYAYTTYTSPAVTVAGYSSYSFSGAPAAISGTMKVGKTVQAVSALTTSGVTKTYKWYKNGVLRQTGGTTLTLKSTDKGASITVRITLDKQGYNVQTVTSAGRTVTS
jgi:hypothetical protein